jgi:TolB-like protein/Tfp pilus assembly protein PilF
MRVAPVVLLGGLLLVLVVAWYHGDRGNQRFKPLELVLLVVILISTGTTAFVFSKKSPSQLANDEGDVVRAKSVAVLPFENLASGEESAYFASGIHDELLTQLAQLGDIKVISRTSAMTYKASTKPLRQIAQELGVATIVEGSVQRSGNRVRVQAQLIDARTDAHLWAERYDRELTDVFEIQSDIARQIATALKAKLSPAEQTRLARKPTSNTEAYDMYLRAREYANRSYGEANTRHAIDFAQKAIALDADFAEAWALLAVKQSDMFWYHYDRSPEIQEASRRSAQRALQLNPDLPDAHNSMASYLYHVKLDYENALKEFGVARAGAPGDADIALLTGAVLRRQGKIADALKYFQESQTLDPRSGPIAQNLGETYTLLRRYDDARPAFERGVDLAPDEVDVALSGAAMQLRHTGDMKTARHLLRYVTPTDKRGIYSPADIHARIEMFEGRPERALAILQASDDSVFFSQFHYEPKSLPLALAYEAMGDAAAARKHYEQALAAIDVASKRLPDDPRIYLAQALAYSGLGRKPEAIAAGVRATKLLPFEREAWRGSHYLVDLALIYTRVGEADKAIDILERLLKTPADVGPGALRTDPAWAPLRKYPRFVALIR